MSSSFEKSVKGGTKIKLAAPKSKYVEHILVATHAGEAGVAEIFRTLQHRLRDSTWTIVFKALIIVHLMIREGEPNLTLKFLAESPSKLAISNFSDVQVQGSNIRHYYMYILIRANAYRDTRLDWVREGQGRLKRQTVDKGLLRETETVQNQISALLKCDILNNEPENEITLTAFRLLTMDLLVLYHVMNEGTINVLEHYFEMSKTDAERALNIYKTFSKQTNQVVEYLSTARQYENATRLEIPKLKHAPTSLTASLEEYLNDPDFDINRRQYLAQQDAKKGRKTTSNGRKEPVDDFKKLSLDGKSTSQGFSDPKPIPAPKHEAKGPAPDLIDFFDSIEQNQHAMSGQSQQQISNFQPIPQYQQQQPMFSSEPASYFPRSGQQPQVGGSFGNGNSFGQPQPQQSISSNFSGAGFSGYGQQPQQSFRPQQNSISSIPQSSASEYPQRQQSFNSGQQPQSTNPFRQSMLPQAAATTSSLTSPIVSPLTRQSTNPFAKHVSTQATTQSQSTPFTSPPPMQPSQPPQQPQASYPLQPQQTGTNPFASNVSPPQAQLPTTSPMISNATGSTNPFRQSMFVNQQTGQGWQSTQGSMSGLEQLDTVPVFPRPGQQAQTQQQAWP